MASLLDYAGVWQRKLLRTPVLTDDQSSVFWLQAGQRHIDLRIPPLRPQRKVDRLDDYTDNELKLLARAEGFSGRTVIDANLCQWRRRFDFQPPTPFRDIARMDFEGADILHEAGIEQEYYERWERLNGSVGVTRAASIRVADARGRWRRALWLRSGGYAALLRPRYVQLEKGDALVQRMDRICAGRATLLSWLDMEISFGRMQSEEVWQITHSLWPFREGTLISVPTAALK